jgi:hypothetical protein
MMSQPHSPHSSSNNLIGNGSVIEIPETKSRLKHAAFRSASSGELFRGVMNITTYQCQCAEVPIRVTLSTYAVIHRGDRITFLLIMGAHTGTMSMLL